jgi:hypothetical protein
MARDIYLCVTSNQLTMCYGNSPLEKRNSNDRIMRGFIIYIGGLNMYPGFDKIINPLIFYKDFVNYDENNQKIFEKEVVQKIRTGIGVINNLPAVGQYPQFPNILQNNLNTINFGWKPCFVSYILDVPGMDFVKPLNNQRSNYLNQPVIFRRDKVIIDYQGVANVVKYNENQSFFDLRYRKYRNASILSMTNLMRDRQGRRIQKPTVPSNDMPYWDHCMDIHIRMEQGRRGRAANNGLDLAVPGSNNWLTIVFDPPQTNGGGGGPP